jgi:FkbM family methyltransferase
MNITKEKLRELLTRGTVHGCPAHRYVAAKLIVKARIPAFLKFSTPHYRVWLHPSALSYCLYLDRDYFHHDEAVMRNILRPGDTFVDVGANIGGWTLYASPLVGSSGTVYAFEPHPKVARYLTENVRLNGFANIQLFEAAAGDANGVSCLSDRQNDANNNVMASGPIPVKVVRLDSVIPDTPIRLLKLDAEGYELPALAGAREVLSRTQFVYFECWETYFKAYGYSTRHLLDLLRGEGFRIDIPADHGEEFHENLLAYR